MRIALSIITKGDEEIKNLKRCVASLKPHVDGIFITANGEKTEETQTWAKEEGIQYSYLAWSDDFSLQRNYSFSLIEKEKYDWILWADSDDIVYGGEKLREVAEISLKNGFDCVFFDYYYGCIFDGEPAFEHITHIDLIQKRERLLKPHVFEWRGRLHETPVPKANYQPTSTYVSFSNYNIVWIHTEAERDPKYPKNKERMERNKRILERQLQEEREKGGADPRTLLYLMKIYVEMNDKNAWRECITMGEEYLTKSGWDEERAVCLTVMAKCYSFLGYTEKAIESTYRALKEYPFTSMPYLYLAKYYYEIGDWDKAEHFLSEGLTVKEKDTTQMNNELEKKTLAADLTFKLHYFVKKDIRKAYKSIQYIRDLLPNDEGVKKTYTTVRELYDLDVACEGAHKIIRYFENKNKEEKIIPFLSTLPKEITDLEFAYYYYNKYKKPRVWKKNEICYYASLGGPHVETWSPLSLKKGIGGSETAVIKLSSYWARRGYAVVVYADVDKEGVYDGVLWLPYWKFNPRDRFNIFIQWRSSSLAKEIKAKRFFVDLHDLYHPVSIHWDRVDYVMVKSHFHRQLAKKIPNKKFKIISNPI